MKRLMIASVALCALVACDMPSGAGSAALSDPISMALAGKTLTASNGLAVEVGADGTLSGMTPDGSELAGTWTITNGQWCRTLTAPEAIAGTECQDITIEGDQATIVREDGSTGVLTIS